MKNEELSLEFLRACISNDVAKIFELIDVVDINYICKDNNVSVYDRYTTPLCAALSRSNIKIAKLLIDKGADLNISDRYGKTPLMLSLENKEFAELIINRSVDLDIKDNNGDTALILCAFHGYFDVAKLLVEKGADIESTSKSKSTALISALTSLNCTNHPHTKIVELLVNHGANINHKDKEGRTALLMSSYYGHKEAAKLLINKGANLDIKNNYGNTALAIEVERAIKDNKNEMIELLIEKGADVNIQNKKGKTVYDLAFWNFKILLILNHKLYDNKDGNTLLMMACQKKNEEYILYLEQKGEDFFVENKNGESAFKILKRKKYISPVLQSLKESLILIEPSQRLDNEHFIRL